MEEWIMEGVVPSLNYLLKTVIIAWKAQIGNILALGHAKGNVPGTVPACTNFDVEKSQRNCWKSPLLKLNSYHLRYLRKWNTSSLAKNQFVKYNKEFILRFVPD